MNNELRTLMIGLWQSACQDKPLRPSCRVVDGNFVMTVDGNKEQWPSICEAAGVPESVEAHALGETLTVVWPSVADQLFCAGGPLAQLVGAGYEMRPQQLHMGRMVQRAIEMGEPAVVEAGTGTGKSYAYAAVCMALDKRVVISTSNKALQMQLYKKDIPFLQRIFPDRSLALAVGKSNYACKNRVEDRFAGAVKIEDPQLLQWYAETESGNLEEIPFAVDWQALDGIRVDENCTGKMCPYYAECFYYRAKEERKCADVIVTNHALLCLNELYNGAGILPDADVIVVDEAHKLPDYARNALGVEFTARQLEKAIQKAEKHGANTWAQLSGLSSVEAFLRAYQLRSKEPQIGLKKDEVIEAGLSLALEMGKLAKEVWDPDILPSSPVETLRARDADYIRSRASWVAVASSPTEPLYVRWIDQSDRDKPKLVNCPFDVSEFVGNLAGFSREESDESGRLADFTLCARCGRKLTAAVVNVLEGRPYGPDCILHVDPFGDAEKVSLDEWLGELKVETKTVRRSSTPPVIFTSATLAAPDMAHFMRETGIAHALQMQVDSPFDYRKNALLYVPNSQAPDPKDTQFLAHLVEDCRKLVIASQGGAFLLFTSYANMRHCAAELRPDFEASGWVVYVQGELPKLEIAKRFAADGNAILFATKSFFEGVSIDGAALRLVVIDKMPFEAPNPLNQAQEEALRTYAADVLGMTPERAQWYPFDALRVPKMTIELKQGVGRLIRTATDWGVMAILDPRLRTSRYGRNTVLPSLPPAQLVHEPEIVDRFFRLRTQTYPERRERLVVETPTVVYDSKEDMLLWQ